MSRVVWIAILITAAASALAAPVPKEDDAARMIRIYGEPVIPKDAPRLEMRGDTLRIFSPLSKVPTPEDRSPDIRTVSDLTPAVALRVWRQVAGDFTLSVRVSFPLHKATTHRSWQPRVAGLVVWQGEKDHLGLMRYEALDLAGNDGKADAKECFRTILTYPKAVATSTGRLDDSGDAAFLRVRRDGQALTSAYSRDGKEWTEFAADHVEWGRTVKVGIYVKHFVSSPFETTFDNYTLIVGKK